VPARASPTPPLPVSNTELVFDGIDRLVLATASVIGCPGTRYDL
jgi:hypothetical protein